MARHRPFWYLRRDPARVEADIDEELLGHLARRTEDLVAQGLARDAARQQAEREFGDLERARRYCRQQAEEKETGMRRRLAWQDWLHDIRITVRSLARAPLLAVTIVATVGLGIGATTTVMAVVDAALLRPLPYPDAGRLVRIYTDAPPYKFRFSVVDYQALAAQQTAFTQVAVYNDRSAAYTDGTNAERVPIKLVTWSYFDVLGLRPAEGRPFTAADGKAGAPNTAIVSHRFWEQQLGSRADAIGRTIRLDSDDYTVIGVMGTSVGPLERDTDVFLVTDFGTPRRKGPFFLITLGQLPADTPAARAAAGAELRAIDKRLFPLWKSSYQDDKATWGLMDLKEMVVGTFSRLALLSIVAVGLVWLIACVNASNLLIARVTSRRRELAIRTALGASRGRVVRYLMVESGVLACAAAALGVGLAWIGTGLVRDVGSIYVPRATEVSLSGLALWTLAAITLASAGLFGVVPAIHGAGGPVDEGLRSTGRSSTAAAGVRRVRGLLVGSQFVVATPLLVVAGLMLASLNQLRHVDLGIETHATLTAQVQIPMQQYRDTAHAVAFWSELQRRTAALPGVTGVAYVDSRPPDDSDDHNNFDLEASPTPPGQSQPVTAWVGVSPEYFHLFGVKLVEGRLFQDVDTGDGPPVVIVDQAWATRFFPHGSAVGQRMRSGGCTTCPLTTVVGVVSNVRYDGLDTADPGVVYWPMPTRGTSMAGTTRRYIAVRTLVDPTSVVPEIRGALRQIDPSVPLSRVSTIDDMVSQALELPRTLSLLIGVLSLVALALSIVGVYGVMAHYVQQHAKDISIRLALGARRASVLRMIVGRGMTLVGAGVLIGIVLALGLARLVGALLFGIKPYDPATFAASAGLMLMVAAIACWIPAMRAAAADPASILRQDA